jgi:hypothetical protein
MRPWESTWSNFTGDALADPLLLHRHAVQHVGDLHRALVVGDDDELAHVQELLDDQAEALVVRLVQGRVDLVEDAERRRLALEDRHEQRDAGHRLLAARELRDGDRLLAGRAGDHFDAGFERVDLSQDGLVGGLAVLGFDLLLLLDLGFEEHVGLSATEQLAEHPLKMLADRIEGLFELQAALEVHLLDELFELLLAGRQSR